MTSELLYSRRTFAGARFAERSTGLTDWLTDGGSKTVYPPQLVVWSIKISALMPIEQWGFFNVPHLLRHGPILFLMVIFGPRDTHTCCQASGDWSCNYLFGRPGSVPTGNRTPISRTWGERSITRSPRLCIWIYFACFFTFVQRFTCYIYVYI